MVEKRAQTGFGFYIKFGFLEPIKRLELRERIAFGDVVASLPNLMHGAGFVLFISDGVLEILEGYCFDEKWQNFIENFQFSYDTGALRELGKISNIFKK